MVAYSVIWRSRGCGNCDSDSTKHGRVTSRNCGCVGFYLGDSWKYLAFAC